MSRPRDRAVPSGVALACAFLAAFAIADRASAGLGAFALFRGPDVSQVVIDPTGELLAGITHSGGYPRVVVLKRDGRQVLFQKRMSTARDLAWVDEAHLVIASGYFRKPNFLFVEVDRAQDPYAFEAARISSSGELADLLPQVHGQVLWSVQEKGGTTAYRVPAAALVGSQDPLAEDADRFAMAARIEGRVVAWVADAGGRVLAARRHDGKKRAEIWIRDSETSPWRTLLASEDLEELPHPVAMAENGRDLLVTAEGAEGTIALFEMDARTGELGAEVFAHPDADLIDLVYDPSGRVVGVIYEQAGLEVRQHFESTRDRTQRALERAFPERSVSLTSMSRDGRYVTVRTTGPRDPGTFYTLDRQTHEAREVGRTMPWLEEDDLYEVEGLRIARGEVELEAFLSRPRPPRDGGRSPLVVLPHGGPVGVRDTRSFDPLVQFLSDHGFAVLQVNYRGSSGRGRGFLDSADRQWGQAIEDDIDAAVEHAASLAWIDPDRICIVGGSYGGYSALISVIRSPGRYRCAASLNGPTDLPFAYYSHFNHWEEGRQYFEEKVGDVTEEYERLIGSSPAYRADEIDVPLFLAHGTRDERVHVDHFHRMTNMLELLGKPHETYLIEGGYHAPAPSEWVEFAQRLQRFLVRNLDASGSEPDRVPRENPPRGTKR